MSNLGSVAYQQKRFLEAKRLLTESLIKFQELEALSCIANSFGEFAFLATAEGKRQRAARLWSAETAMSEQVGCQRPPNEAARRAQAISAVQEALGEKEFVSAWAAGQALTWEQAAAFALGEDALNLEID